MVAVVVAGLAGLLAALVCLVLGRREHRAVAERFPPISDEEFLGRCRPGADPAIALRVRRMVADYYGVEYDRIHPSTRFVDDLGAE